MKVLKSTLRKIILEEYRSVLKEQDIPPVRKRPLAQTGPPPVRKPPKRSKPTKPAKRALEFDDLIQVTNLAIQVVLRQVDRDDLILALIGAPTELQDHILANVSSRAANDIREEMEAMTSSYVGPGKPRARRKIPASRIRSAQQRILQAVDKLAKDGSIYLPVDAEFKPDPKAAAKSKEKKRARPGYGITKSGDEVELPAGATKFAQWEGKEPQDKLLDDHLKKKYNK